MIAIQFGRAQGARKACDRPNERSGVHLGDSRWWNEVVDAWREDRWRQVHFELRWCRPQPTATTIPPTTRTLITPRSSSAAS